MKLVSFAISLFLCFQLSAQSFKVSQQKCARVKTAYQEKWDGLKTEMLKQGIKDSNFEMYLQIFKNEKIVEVWLKSKESEEYKLFKSYSICASSGDLGPKRKQGDGQVPEGFYHIAAFNPYSSYYLSLGVSYPNASDKIVPTLHSPNILDLLHCAYAQSVPRSQPQTVADSLGCYHHARPGQV